MIITLNNISHDHEVGYNHSELNSHDKDKSVAPYKNLKDKLNPYFLIGFIVTVALLSVAIIAGMAYFCVRFFFSETTERLERGITAKSVAIHLAVTAFIGYVIYKVTKSEDD